LKLAATSLHIRGPLDVGLLEQSIEGVAYRHESLRTEIVLVDGIARQRIKNNFRLSLRTLNLTTTSPQAGKAEVIRLGQSFIKEDGDTSDGSMFEAQLYRFSDADHVLIIAVNHIVSDAVSCAILGREVWQLYDRAVLPSLPLQFPDYAIWQQRIDDAWNERDAPYWRNRMIGAPYTLVPRDRSLEDQRNSVNTLHFPFGAALTMRLRAIAEREQIRLPLLVLAAYVLTVSRWIGQSELVVVFLSHGRHLHPGLKYMIGLLSNLLHLRVEVDEQEPFFDLVRRLKSELDAANEHFDYGRFWSVVPDFRTEFSFNWLTIDRTQASARNASSNDQLSVQPLPLKIAWPVIFEVYCSDTPSGICAAIAYQTGMFLESTVRRFGERLRALTERCSLTPFDSISSLHW